MKKSDLNFDYPDSLVALSPQRPSRVMWCQDQKKSLDQTELPKQPEQTDLPDQSDHSVQDLKWTDFLQKMIQDSVQPKVLVVNDTKVLKRRLFFNDIEILFLSECQPDVWEVLFPAKNFKIGHRFQIHENIQLELVEKGRPQKLKVINSEKNKSEFSFTSFLDTTAELPLPPYIQKLRDQQRHALSQDENWYQTSWAQKPGSLAAPTASLHFSESDLDYLSKNGFQILKITLHVGLGTFLPITAPDLSDHKMHAESVEIPVSVWNQILQIKKQGGAIWAMGTTVTRALESLALYTDLEPHLLNSDVRPLKNDLNLLKNHITVQGDTFLFKTDLMIKPGFEFKIVNRLLTNFHQPESTLLALVSAFSSLENVKKNYQWAIEKKFRLFSYGDLNAWIK